MGFIERTAANQGVRTWTVNQKPCCVMSSEDDLIGSFFSEIKEIEATSVDVETIGEPASKRPRLDGTLELIA